MQIIEFFESIYRPHKLRNRSPNTVRLYRHSIAKFGRFLCRIAALADLRDDVVSSYLAHLVGCGLSPFTVNKERSQLLAIWNYAARKGHLDRFPDVEPEQCPERIPQAWLERDLCNLMDACRNQPGDICGVPAGSWWTALHLVIWDTGERIGAVMQSTWANYGSGWLLIPAKARKGKRADRQTLLGQDTQDSLSTVRDPRRLLIFPWPRKFTSIYYHYGKILRDAGLPDDGRCKFHRIRRSVASHYEAAGGNATELLGHTSRRTTRAYLDPRIAKAVQPCEVLFRIGKE